MNDPSAERKKRIPASISDFRRPNPEAHKPEIAAPMTQPINALEDVIPCMKSVYTKSEAPMKNACRPFSAPDMTAVSYPNSRPPITATRTIENR